MITAIQSKMARAALGWGVRDLAKKAEVSIDTITRLERGEVLQPRTIAAIVITFQNSGIEFVEDFPRIGVIRSIGDDPELIDTFNRQMTFRE